MVQEGLERTLGKQNLYTLEPTVLCIEMSLGHDQDDDPERDKHLQEALMTCIGWLLPGSPMAIRNTSRLVNHWEDTKGDIKKIEKVERLQWEALTKGYDADTVVAIMKITDLKRENPFPITR
jgi:hypothetical protein